MKTHAFVPTWSNNYLFVIKISPLIWAVYHRNLFWVHNQVIFVFRLILLHCQLWYTFISSCSQRQRQQVPSSHHCPNLCSFNVNLTWKLHFLRCHGKITVEKRGLYFIPSKPSSMLVLEPRVNTHKTLRNCRPWN